MTSLTVPVCGHKLPGVRVTENNILKLIGFFFLIVHISTWTLAFSLQCSLFSDNLSDCKITWVWRAKRRSRALYEITTHRLTDSGHVFCSLMPGT